MEDGVRTTLIRAVSRDPGHAGALFLCSVLPRLATHARRTHGDGGRSGESGQSTDERAAAVVRHSRTVARRDGAFTGTSFYFGIPAVMASIYCHQVLMVLQIATVYGHDPFDQARAAEILVLQGKSPDVPTAAAMLEVVGATSEQRGKPKTTLRHTLRELPASARRLPAAARAKWKAFRAQGPVSMVFAVLDIACYLVPFIGSPVSAASNARSTRLLGDKARAFYGSGAPQQLGRQRVDVSWGVKPAPPIGALVVLVLVTAAVLAVTLVLALHGSHRHRHTRWLFLSLAAAFVMITYWRLWRILRPERRRGQPTGQSTEPAGTTQRQS